MKICSTFASLKHKNKRRMKDIISLIKNGLDWAIKNPKGGLVAIAFVIWQTLKFAVYFCAFFAFVWLMCAVGNAFYIN